MRRNSVAGSNSQPQRRGSVSGGERPRSLSVYGGFGLSRRASVASTTGRASVASTTVGSGRTSGELGPALPETFVDYEITTVRSPTPFNVKKLNSLQLAAYNGDVNKVQGLILEKKRDVDKLDTVHKVTALHIAAEKGDVEVTKALITGGRMGNGEIKRASLDVKNQDGRTALILAAMFMKSDIVLLLVANQAQLDIMDTIGCGALHYALLNNDRTSFEALVQAGASLRIRDKTNNTLLHHAARMGHEDLCKFLIDPGADVNAGNSEQRTPLHLAVQSGHGNIVQLLLEHNADIKLSDNAGQTADDLVDPSDHRLMELLLSKKLEQVEFAGPKEAQVTSGEDNAGLSTAAKSTLDNDKNFLEPPPNSEKSPGWLSELPTPGRAASQISADKSILSAAEAASPVRRLGLELVYETSEFSLNRLQRDDSNPVLLKAGQTAQSAPSSMHYKTADQLTNENNASAEVQSAQSEVSESLDLDTELLDALDDDNSSSISDENDDEISIISPASPRPNMSEPKAVQEAPSLMSVEAQHGELPLPLASNAERRAHPAMSVRIDAPDPFSQKKAVKLDPGELTAAANRLLVDLKLIEQKYAGQDEISSVVSVLVNYVRDTNEIALAADEDTHNYKLLWKALRSEMSEPSNTIFDENVSPDRSEVVEFVQKLRNRRGTEATIAGSPTSPMGLGLRKGFTNIKSPKQWAETKHAQLSYEIKALHEWIDDAKQEVLEEGSEEHESPEEAAERATLDKETLELVAKRRALLVEFAGLNGQQPLPTLLADAGAAIHPASGRLLEGDAQALARSLAAEKLVNQRLTEKLNALKTDHEHLLSSNSSLEKRLDELQDKYLKFNEELALKQYEFEMADAAMREAQYRDAELSAEEHAALKEQLLRERAESKTELHRAELELQQATEKLADEVRQREISSNALSKVRAEYEKIQAELEDAQSRLKLQLDIEAELAQKLEQTETATQEAHLVTIERCTHLEGTIDTLSAEIDARKITIDSLTNETAELRSTLQALTLKANEEGTASESLVKYYDTEMRLLAAQIASEKELRIARDEEHVRISQKVAELEASLSQADEEHTTWATAAKDAEAMLNERLRHMADLLSGLEADVAERTEAIDALEHEKTELTRALEAAQAAVVKLAAELDEKNVDHECMLKRLEDNNQLGIQELAEERDALAEMVKALTAQISEQREANLVAFVSLEQERDSLKESIADLREQIHKLELTVRTSEEKRAEQVAALEKERDGHLQALNTLREQEPITIQSALAEEKEARVRQATAFEQEKDSQLAAINLLREENMKYQQQTGLELAEAKSALEREMETRVSQATAFEQEKDSQLAAINLLREENLEYQQQTGLELAEAKSALEKEREARVNQVATVEQQRDALLEATKSLREQELKEIQSALSEEKETRVRQVTDIERERDAQLQAIITLREETLKQKQQTHMGVLAAQAALGEEQKANAQLIASLKEQEAKYLNEMHDATARMAEYQETIKALEAQVLEHSTLREENLEQKQQTHVELLAAQAALGEEQKANAQLIASLKEQEAKYSNEFHDATARMAEYQETINALEAQVLKHSALVEVFERETAENQKITRDLDATKTECLRYEAELREARASISLLETEIKGLEEARTRANVADTKLQTALHEKAMLEGEKSNLEASLASVSERVAQLDSTIRDKESERKALDVQLSQLMTQHNAAQVEIRSYHEATVAAETENERLASQLRDSNLEKDTLELSCKALSESQTQSELQIDTLSRELSFRQQEIHELAQSLETIKHDHATEICELGTELTSVTHIREALAAQLAESQESLEKTQVAIAELQHVSSRDHGELDLLRDALERSQAQIATLTSSENQLVMDKQELQRILACKEEALKQGTEIFEYNYKLLQSADLRVETLLGESRRLHLDLRRLQTVQAQWDTERQILEHELELRTSSAAATELELNKLQRDYKQASQKLQALEAALFGSDDSATAEADASIYEMAFSKNLKISALSKELEDLREKSRGTQQGAPRVMALELENAKLKTTLAKLKTDVQRMEADLRKSYNANLSKIVTKLDEQQKERHVVEAGWMRNQTQLKEGYERQIRALSGELAGLKRTVKPN
ncbi:hypothetical protein HDU87_002084 [Geranomyces variabilis]|uniref:Uncharacterized protein n=1 Tax=Geranomyces variabilis TaxID=109894 RepID=A0AAD5TNS8_9FUNG|nr:hypothetical protein HDU87_002084 [Geranomyces variabilis]